MPLAMRREPSRIEPGELGGRPFSYAEVVQPVLNEHCVRCHGGEETEQGIDLTGDPHKGFARSYWALCVITSYSIHYTKLYDSPLRPRTMGASR